MKIEQAVFLVGGLGTRLGDLTKETPKPLLEVAGRPFLDILIENAASHGLRRFLLLAGHLGGVVAERYATWGAARGLKIECLVEAAPAGTAGALRFAKDHLDEVFLLANGDTLFAVDPSLLAETPANAGWRGKLALRRVADGSRYGNIRLDGSRVVSFGGPATPAPALVNGGVYILRREILDDVLQTPCSLEADVFPAAAVRGELFAREFDSYFVDIGVPEDLARARDEIPQLLARGLSRRE